MKVDPTVGDVLTPGEVARYLRIGRTLAYRLLGAGAIPSFRVGRSIRVRRRDLDVWVGSTTHQMRGTRRPPLSSRKEEV